MYVKKGRQIPTWFIALGDVILINVALLLAYYLRFRGNLPEVNVQPFYHLAPFIMISTIVVFQIFDLYKRNWNGIDRSIRTIFVAIICLFLLINTATFWLRGFAFPRSVLGLGFIMQLIFIWLWRTFCWHLERRIHGSLEVVAIASPSEKDIFEKLLSSNSGYFRISKIIPVEDFDLSQDFKKADAFLVLSSVPEEYKVQLLNHCIAHGKTLFLVPRLYEIFIGKAEVKQIDDLPILELNDFVPSPGLSVIKRVIDIVISAIGLLILLPLMAIVVLAIKATSPGPVFYMQERVGQGGKTFMLYKFRTMIDHAEDKTGPVLASNNDCRITPVGRILRATRIDEIPQLWNVLKGDMSIVGPRPERPFFTHKLEEDMPAYRYRYLVKPGITGLAQILGKYRTSPDDKLRYDLLYIRNLSLFQDVKIMMQTVPVMMNGEAADGYQNKVSNNA